MCHGLYMVLQVGLAGVELNTDPRTRRCHAPLGGLVRCGCGAVLSRITWCMGHVPRGAEVTDAAPVCAVLRIVTEHTTVPR